MAIGGVARTEATYRAVMLDSSSSLKDFCLDRKKYFKKYLMNEDVEDKDSQAAVMGRVVETLLMEPELFDSRFYMSACSEPPTGNMLNFVEALYKFTKEATDDVGEVTRTFEEISRSAYVESGYKIPYERVMTGTDKTKGFIGTDNEIYYNEIRKVRGGGLTVVTTQDISNAERIVQELKTNFVTKEMVNLVSSTRYSVRNQLQIEGYTVGGHLFKSMMDKVIIDHQLKTIQVIDLKCVWAVEGFYDEYYLYRRAYIQAYLYYRAAMEMTKPGWGNEDLSDYTVLPPQFLVCDSTNYFNPLIYQLTYEDLADALLGFSHKGRDYVGVKELIEDLNWALTNNIWNISRKNYLSNGIVNLKD